MTKTIYITIILLIILTGILFYSNKDIIQKIMTDPEDTILSIDAMEKVEKNESVEIQPQEEITEKPKEIKKTSKKLNRKKIKIKESKKTDLFMESNQAFDELEKLLTN